VKIQKILTWKLFNKRPFVFGLAAMVAGIFLAFSFFVSYWFLVGFGICVAAFVVAAISRHWFSAAGQHKTTIVIVLICFLLGVVSMSIREGVYRKNSIVEGVYYINAKVVATTKYEDELYRTKIENVELFDSEIKVLQLKLNEAGYVWTKTDFEIGDIISFVGYYKAVEHDNISEISPNNAYKISVYSSVNVLGNSKTIFEKYKSLVLKDVTGNMNEASAGTAFAMLCGDASKVEHETKDSYRAAGIGHILAVSGLHVGFFVLLLSIIFNALHVNKKTKFAIITIVLAIYCWLCGFSYSVLRASIMCVVLLYAEIRSRQYDGLSALCFATIIILGFIDPYQLFAVSFLLSFFSVFSMFCLYKWLDCNFRKIYPKRLAGSLAIGIATSIGILPWQIYYFGYFSTFGILLNLIAIPLASVAFMLCFVIVPITLIIPQFGILVKSSEYVFWLLNEICGHVNEVPFSVVHTTISPITIALWYVAIALCSDYVFLPKKAKLWTRIGSIAAVVLLFGLNLGGVF